jgi:hypothetical protein
MKREDKAEPASAQDAPGGGKQTLEEHSRLSGSPPLPADHPLYKAGYVIGGKRLKDYAPSPQPSPAPQPESTDSALPPVTRDDPEPKK